MIGTAEITCWPYLVRKVDKKSIIFVIAITNQALYVSKELSFYGRIFVIFAHMSGTNTKSEAVINCFAFCFPYLRCSCTSNMGLYLAVPRGFEPLLTG